jgi:hypothetical protein
MGSVTTGSVVLSSSKELSFLHAEKEPIANKLTIRLILVTLIYLSVTFLGNGFSKQKFC